MPTCAEILSRTLREAGITRMFGLPGGEILDFMEAARRAGIEFLLTRHEATASLMADVTGQISRRPGVCVSTLGPGAVNMTLGVANAFLDRSPLIAITASHALAASPLATHQNLDLNAVYRPFTKLAMTLDAINTASKVRRAIAASLAPRMGPVHIALPSDVARSQESEEAPPVNSQLPTPNSQLPTSNSQTPSPKPQNGLEHVARALQQSRRPVAVLGLDLEHRAHAAAVRHFVESLRLPVFVTPKAKGIFPEDHALFYGVCAGVSADTVVLDLFRRSDLLVGIGFEPVESDKLWHHELPLVSVGPLSIASGAYRPRAEAVGDVVDMLGRLERDAPGPFDWTDGDRATFRGQLDRALRPQSRPRGLSAYELTRRLRELFPRDAIFTTDVGSVKMVTTQAWTTYEPMTFFESNGLSAMSYSLPAAMAARLQFPGREILCTIGDGGFGMTLADLETCVREDLRFVIIVFNDSSLSLIDAAQQRRGYPTLGVRYGAVDFATVARGFGAWGARVRTLEELDDALAQARKADRVAVVDVLIDPAEYVTQRC